MKRLALIVLLTISVLTNFVKAGERSVVLVAHDSTCWIEKWKEQPAVPLPTLDHHLGKITASISVFSVLSLSGVDRRDAALITSGAALTFEAIQYLFFDETLRHSAMDMVLFSFHLPMYTMLEREHVVGVAVTVNLTALYLLFL